MSIYQTMIRADIESRELMGVTPEQALYLSVWLCLASWISGGHEQRGSTARPIPS